MTLNDKQNNPLISPSIGGGYQTLIPTKSTKGEDIWYKIKLSCSVLIKKISSLLSVDYCKSNSENQFKDIQLQLHASSSVSNPYTFNIQGNTNFSGICVEDNFDVTAYGAKPWYGDNWPDASKVSKLIEIDDGVKFNAKNVTTMTKMFQGCKSLTSIDLSNFDTSKVTNTKLMFSVCFRLASLDLSNFNTSKVSIMSHMFYNCGSLNSLDLSSFDTSNVTDMQYMFYYCKSLTSLDLSNFDTSNVTNMHYMFDGCNSLQTLDYSLKGFLVNNLAPILGDSLKTLRLYDLKGATNYVDLFLTKAKVPSSCKVTIVS